MLAFTGTQRVGSTCEIKFTFKGQELVASLRADGGPSFEKGIYPKLAVEQLDDWALDNVEMVSRLQSALR